MKKIIFNDKYCLTKAVLEGRKTQTRRVLNPTMFFKRLETYEGWSNEDISAWEKSCIRRFYEAQGEILQQMLDYALSSSRYKIGEEVAVAQAYRRLKVDRDRVYSDMEILEITYSKGWRNKMFVKSDLMPHRIRITNLRVERLQEISDEDCIAEGIQKNPEVLRGMWGFSYIKGVTLKFEMSTTPRGAYAKLIDHISGKGTWESNPYVFVYEFELIK